VAVRHVDPAVGDSGDRDNQQREDSTEDGHVTTIRRSVKPFTPEPPKEKGGMAAPPA